MSSESIRTYSLLHLATIELESAKHSVMDPAPDVPSALRRQMSSVASVTTLNTYRTGVGKDVFGGALNVDAHFDRQTAQFVSRMPSPYVPGPFRFP